MIDPTGTTATLDTTTTNGCRVTLSLQAVPASPIDGVGVQRYETYNPFNGYSAGVGVYRVFPASGTGSWCDDAGMQGSSTSGSIGQAVGATVIQQE